MSRASFMHELFSPSERDSLRELIRGRAEKQKALDLKSVKLRFMKWVEHNENIKKMILEEEQRLKVIEILKSSHRGHRSTMEKETIRRFLVNNLTCLPKTISFSEMDKLCNEIDWFPLIGRSILFLQGDFGNVYYMIARGTVGLYLEPSKDREMTIAREFGNMRAQAFYGTDEDLKRLGNNIFNLSKGAGFGEYAILASTNKIRSCAAVALDEDSFLLVMHADTYNEVLRQHHYRQKQLSSATALLQELPLFKQHNYSKIASLAYTMKSQTYSSGTTLVRSGDLINNVLLISSGQVKVFAPPNKDILGSHGHALKVVEKRIPKLAVAMLGRGQIIGEVEIHKGHRLFQMTYETSAASTEILEMPATVFKESIGGSEFRQSTLYKSIEGLNEEKELTRAGRLSRAYDVMKKMMEGESKQLKMKEDLLSILPNIIDPALGCTSSPTSSVKAKREQLLISGMYDSGNAIQVPRRILCGESSSGKSNNGNKLADIAESIASVAVRNNTTSSSPFSPKSALSSKSPRKLNFIATNNSSKG